MTKVDFELPEISGIDLKFPCIMCAANHTHIIRHDGRQMRVCYDCNEILENEIL